jgi:hypothetical protein
METTQTAQIVTQFVDENINSATGSHYKAYVVYALKDLASQYPTKQLSELLPYATEYANQQWETNKDYLYINRVYGM